MENISFVESEVIRLFGRITPVSINAYVQFLRNNLDNELTKIGMEIILRNIRIANQLLISILKKIPKPNDVVATDIKQEIGSNYSHYFQVPYDWQVVPKNREINTKTFFKLYTMNNDSGDILWHIKHELN